MTLNTCGGGLSMSEREQQEKQKRKERKQMDRGAADDWEAVKMVLEGLPALKQRVLHRIRTMKNKQQDQIKVSAREAKEYQRLRSQEKKKK